MVGFVMVGATMTKECNGWRNHDKRSAGLDRVEPPEPDGGPDLLHDEDGEHEGQQRGSGQLELGGPSTLDTRQAGDLQGMP